jgi:epsin
MSWKSRVTGIEDYQSSGSPPRRPGERQQRVQRTDEEDAEYKLAIEASKYQEEEDRKKRESKQGEPDDDLAKAIKLSKEEEDLRRRELEESNELSLFDGDPIQTPQPQYTGFNQGYQQQGAVDWAGNPIDQTAMMQSQPTGFLNTMYNSSPVTFQVQPANYQNGVSNSFGPHQSGFDPYGQQQTSPFTTTPTGYNPYTQQQQQNLSQQSLQLQQKLEPVIPPSTNPWAIPQQQSSLAPMPTGSNNPFASSVSNNRTFPTSTNSQPTLSTLQEQKTLGQLSNTPSFTTPSFPVTPQKTQTSFPATSQKTQTSYEAKLSSLLESGEGMDTFGNTGNLRIPAQHTAPGTFVNSAGAGLNRITEQQTSTNPFLPSQFTGMPPTSYAGQSGSLVGRQFPAATGPAGIGTNGFGASGSSNPFGQRQQQNGQSGDLIQF